MKKVIAIDGPSGSGKGTISRILAGRLGYTYLDTGALYRAIALKLRKCSVQENASDQEIENVLRTTTISFSSGRVLLDGNVLHEEIRTPEIGHYSSVFSARKVVRDFLLQVQRTAADDNDLIAEGRDMTTVVFPHAHRKFFLTASETERAHRRYLQLKEKGMAISPENALRDVRERDARDSARDIAPLKKAHDAIEIDTTSLTIDETVDTILEYV